MEFSIHDTGNGDFVVYQNSKAKFRGPLPECLEQIRRAFVKNDIDRLMSLKGFLGAGELDELRTRIEETHKPQAANGGGPIGFVKPMAFK